LKLANLQKLVDDLSSLTVLEAADLAKMLEEKWGASTVVPEFISEDDVATFEGWLRYQGVDAAATAPDELAKWRSMFDEGRASNSPKVGLMKLQSLPGEHRYGVALREGSDLWLTLWVRRSPKGEFFVMTPRGVQGWDPHTSYHLDGTLHMKSHGRIVMEKKIQRLTGPFRGTEHLGGYGGHGPKTVGAICDPTAFLGVFEVPPGVLGPRDGMVVVDLVEPGCEPITWPFTEAARQTFKDALPWVVIRVGTTLPAAT
jgi:hypothetical protein